MSRQPRKTRARKRARASRESVVTSRPRRRAAKRPSLFGRLVKAGLVLGVAGAVVLGGWLVMLARDLPDTSGLFDIDRPASIAFLDHEGRLIARRGSPHGPPADVETLPDYLIDAVLAVEDRRFFSHPGIDPIGMGRALVANLRAGRVVQGGSALTQQLAKNLFLTPERTMRRKVQEIMLALWLESRFSKEEILGLYLNRVYFGSGAWGVEAASQRYFGVSASEIDLGQAAILAGLLKAPSRFSPVNDASRAATRATVVLDLMTQTGRITPEERLAAAETPVRVSRGASSPGAQYFIDWVAPQVRELVGEGHADLVVTTTLDVAAQRAAEAALASVLDDPETAAGATEGALVALSHDGAVRAMAGGRDYSVSQFNRAVLARRQPGSAFKPFVYAAAFEAGLLPEDVREDAPISVGDWSPENYNGEYRGEMPLSEAFARSSNAVAVRVAEETGRGYIARLAERFGIESTLRIDRALALGAYEVTPLELSQAYLPFANGGRRADAFGVARIETPDGEVLWEAEPAAGEIVLDARNLGRMRSMMRGVVTGGTGRRAATPGLETAGKTGTTNDFRDAWFAGYGGELVTTVWVGNDDFSPTERATGGGPPARIFSAFLGAAPRDGLGGSFGTPTARQPEPEGAETPLSIASEDTPPDAEPAPEEAEVDPIGAFLAGLEDG
jgi:penicillin-binding protein 1A